MFSPAREICNHVIKYAACSKICILHPLQTWPSLQDLPIHPTSLVHGAVRVAGRFIIPRVSTAHFFLRRDFFFPFSNQSDKLHMTSQHKRTKAASSRCCSVHCPLSGKLGLKQFLSSFKEIFVVERESGYDA